MPVIINEGYFRQKTETGSEIFYPKTTWGNIVDKPDLSNYVDFTSEQTIIGKKTFAKLYVDEGYNQVVHFKSDGIQVHLSVPNQQEETMEYSYPLHKSGTLLVDKDLESYVKKDGDTLTGNLDRAAPEDGSGNDTIGYLVHNDKALLGTLYGNGHIRYTVGSVGSFDYTFPTKSGRIVVDKDLEKYLTLDTAQDVTAKKTFKGYYYMNGTKNTAGDTAPQFYGLRIKGDGNYGAQLNFGDGNLIYFYEYEDDRLRLHTKKFDFDGLSEGLSFNKSVGSDGQVLTSHGSTKAPTWETQNFVTLNTSQIIDSIKTFRDDKLHVSNSADYQDAYTSYNTGNIYRSLDERTSYQYDFPDESGTLALSKYIKTYSSGTGISISASNAISTTAASSTESGHVSTGAQTFAGRKTFNGGINIPRGATIQLNGSSGVVGQVLTSNGALAPAWKDPPSVSVSALDFFRVGYVYISFVSTSPASMFGGSWTAITGVFPYFNAGTGTGGSNTHTLTESEMPSHRHNINIDGNGSNTYESICMQQKWTRGELITDFIQYSGGGAAFSIMPKYQTFYAWRRTA